MKKPSHRNVKQLIGELILPFFMIERDMLVPVQPRGKRRNENDAEHAWSVAVLACSLAQHIDKNLDVGLICQFAIVHDLVELYAGDTSVWSSDKALQQKDTIEKRSLKKIKTHFAEFPWLIETIERYEKQDSAEARYVRAIDKYIALTIRFMDGGEFYNSQGITKEIYDKNMVTHRVKAHGHPGVAKYYEKIRAEYEKHPEHFYRAEL